MSDAHCKLRTRDILGAVHMSRAIARLTGLTQFFRLLWELKYPWELKLKRVAALSNMKACHQAK